MSPPYREWLSVAGVVVVAQAVVLAVAVARRRWTQELPPKVDDDAFVEVDMDGVVVVADGACLLRLMSSGQDMSSGLNWSPNEPLSPSWLVLMSRRGLCVDSVDDELWGRFFTLAEGDGGVKLKSSLKVVDADDNGGPLFRR